MSTFQANDGTDSWEVDATSLEDALDQSVEDVRNCDGYDQNETTCWVRVTVTGEDEISDAQTVTIDPVEPSCTTGGEHDWQSPLSIVGGIADNPGVWGNGGGVISKECCMNCGCQRKIDTWAQNPATGEQGLQSVAYEPELYAEDLAQIVT